MKQLFRRLITRFFARLVVRLVTRNPQLRIIAVGGSVGKTSTKMAIAKVLEQKYRVLVHEGNYNSELGLPLSLFELDSPTDITDIGAWLQLMRAAKAALRKPYPYDVAVIEVGIDHVGDMDKFMAYLKPDIGIVTAIAPEHMEHFADLSMVADEEFKLDQGSKAVVLNLGDEMLVERRDKLGTTPVTTYGKGGEIDWSGRDAIVIGKETIKVTSHVLGEHSRLALLAAAAVATRLGLSSEEIKRGIDQVVPVSGRMQTLKGRDDVVIIDDSYNSSPEAALAALKTLDSTANGRRIALRGQMNELGSYSQEAHEQVGKAAAKLDILLTLGADANTYLGPAAVKAGLDKTKVHTFTSPYDAGEWLSKVIKKGDTILVKGSQNGVFAEEAIKSLLADPADSHKLVRQSPEWLVRKTEQFSVYDRKQS